MVAEAEAILADIKTLTDDEEVVRDTFEGEFDIDQVIDHLLKITAEDEMMIVAIDLSTEQLTKRKRRLQERLAFGKTLIKRALTVAGVRKRERPLGTSSLNRKSPTLAPLDEALIPPEYYVQPERPDPYPDKDKILAVLKEHRAQMLAAEKAGDAARVAELKAMEPVPGAKLADEELVVHIRRV